MEILLLFAFIALIISWLFGIGFWLTFFSLGALVVFLEILATVIPVLHRNRRRRRLNTSQLQSQSWRHAITPQKPAADFSEFEEFLREFGETRDRGPNAPPAPPAWSVVLGIKPDATLDQIKRRCRYLVGKHRGDPATGKRADVAKLDAIAQALREAKAERGVHT